MAVADAQTTELTVADDVLGRDNSVCSTGVWVSERTKRDEIVVHWSRAVLVDWSRAVLVDWTRAVLVDWTRAVLVRSVQCRRSS